MNELMKKFNLFYLLESFKDHMKSEEGQTLVEYALILVLIAIVVLLMLAGVGTNVNTTFSKVNSALK